MTRWGDLLNRGIDCGAGLYGQRLNSGSFSVHLQDIGGYTHNVLVVGEPGLFKRKLSLLKAGHQLGRGLRTPALQERLARERRHAVIEVRDELPICLGERTDRGTFIRVALT